MCAAKRTPEDENAILNSVVLGLKFRICICLRSNYTGFRLNNDVMVNYLVPVEK